MITASIMTGVSIILQIIMVIVLGIMYVVVKAIIYLILTVKYIPFVIMICCFWFGQYYGHDSYEYGYGREYGSDERYIENVVGRRCIESMILSGHNTNRSN